MSKPLPRSIGHGLRMLACGFAFGVHLTAMVESTYGWLPAFSTLVLIGVYLVTKGLEAER